MSELKMAVNLCLIAADAFWGLILLSFVVESIIAWINDVKINPKKNWLAWKCNYTPYKYATSGYTSKGCHGYSDNSEDVGIYYKNAKGRVIEFYLIYPGVFTSFCMFTAAPAIAYLVFKFYPVAISVAIACAVIYCARAVRRLRSKLLI